MTTAVLVALTHPASSEVDAEFNTWYDEVHLPDLLRIPGIVSARRFKLSEAQLDDVVEAHAPYLAIYEIETDDLPSVLEEIKRRAGTSEMPISNALGLRSPVRPSAVLFEQL